ncbi:GNAT family N-acetyltransferase [Deinococcus irradiatisoli]|uniref:GNAT family N-acetyltransferase n=1 Tax=Deinococcus irradiatisoli TaxID=2202254 RepID=A0A2Z3JKJ9_9DEIO|nr:GNAT family N-acetyltransferase [Deinococcus irradiatisoli]AWN24416.1 GNAT family N-acetyltransferase [Deinococcus irradiatisoli]
MTDLSIRDLRAPADFAAVAAVRNAAEPDWPVTPELLERWHAVRDPALYHLELVAELEGRIVGHLGVGHDDFAFQEDRYWGSLTVHPEFRRRGVGSALHSRMMDVLVGRGAGEIRTMLAEDASAGLAFLEQRGYRLAWTRLDLRLNVADVPQERFDSLLHSVAERGLQLVSIADLAADPRRDERLWELDWLLFQDVPMGQALTKRPLAAWVAEELQDPTFEPELSFVVLDPGRDDPLTGPYVGYSTLMGNPGGFYVIGMTGVLRGYRRLGLAKALKVAAMRSLSARGGGEIRTFNDAPNAAMVGMNEALGFVRWPSRLRYELHLERP